MGAYPRSAVVQLVDPVVVEYVAPSQGAQFELLMRVPARQAAHAVESTNKMQTSRHVLASQKDMCEIVTR